MGQVIATLPVSCWHDQTARRARDGVGVTIVWDGVHVMDAHGPYMAGGRGMPNTFSEATPSSPGTHN